MSRDWKEEEVEALGDGLMQCVVGDTTRSAYQIDVSTLVKEKPVELSSWIITDMLSFHIRLQLMGSLLSLRKGVL